MPTPKIIAPCPPWIMPMTVVTEKNDGELQKHTVTPQGQLTVYSIGEPTNEEQQVIEYINRARSNPPAEGMRLDTTTDPDISAAYTYWGKPTRSQVLADFQTYQPRPPFAPNAHLFTSARGHCQKMIEVDSQYHIGPDGSPQSRATAAGYAGYAGESAYAYGTSPWDIHATFQIDFGNPAKGHRDGNMDFSGLFTYNEIGIGIVHGTGSGTPPAGFPDVGPLVTAQEFGIASPNANTFVTGVVYGDDNQNNFYDIGEGLGGVTITLSTGSYSAVSSASGGYAIPFTDQGTFTVTASGGGLTSPISHDVTLGSENVKIDFIQSSSGYPAQTILQAPIADTIIHTDTAYFSWNPISEATKYYIQVATDKKMTAIILKDSSLTKPSKQLPGLKNGTTYYWRVQAKNSIGWGLYSPVASFSVGLPLPKVVLVSPADGSNVSSNDVDLKWKDTNPVALAYWIEISTLKTITNHIISDSSLTSPEDLIPASTFSPGTTYYWRIRAENDNGWSAPSAIWSFTTGTSSVAILGLNNPISISPNPTRGNTHIRFRVSDEENVTLKIFDLLGSDASTLLQNKLSPNDYDIIWDTNDMPAGIYCYELYIGSRHDVGKIILLK